MCCCYQRGQKTKYITGIGKMSKNKNSLSEIVCILRSFSWAEIHYCRASQTILVKNIDNPACDNFNKYPIQWFQTHSKSPDLSSSVRQETLQIDEYYEHF